MADKKALSLLKKYYLPYRTKEKLSDAEIRNAVRSGILVPDSAMTHDEIVTEIKALTGHIALDVQQKHFCTAFQAVICKLSECCFTGTSDVCFLCDPDRYGCAELGF